MSCFILALSISHSDTRIAGCAAFGSLEIQKHINRALAGIRLQPVADVFVVQRQLPENLFLVGLEFCQEFLELSFVEDVTGGKRPGRVELSLSGRRNSSEDHFAEVILRALLNAHRIEN